MNNDIYNERKKIFEDYVKKFINNSETINENNIEDELKKMINETQTEEQSNNYETSNALFDSYNAFNVFLELLKGNEKFKKLHEHLNNNKTAIDIIFSKYNRDSVNIKILKNLLLFINYDCDNNADNNECKKYREFDKLLIECNNYYNKTKKTDELTINYKIYFPSKITILLNFFKGNGKRKNRKTKHVKRKNQKAKSRKNQK